jgi:preprotein translocase subunit SecD
MERSWYWRLGLVVVVTLATLWFLIPSYYSLFVLEKTERNNLALLEQRMPRWAPPASYRINLGLDLQGGIHMVMRVDTRTALQKRTERRGEQIARYINEKQLGEVTAEADPERLQLALTAKDPATMDAIEKEVLQTYTDFVKVSRDGATLVLTPEEGQVTRFREEAVDQAMLTIRSRIDKWGVAEVDVRKLGTDAIQISLPGRSDPERAKELVGTTAQLEFRMVDDTTDFFRQTYQTTPPPEGSNITLDSAEGFPQLVGPNREALLSYVKEQTPQDRQVLLECIPSATRKGACDSYRTYLVEKEVPLTGESITSADASLSQLNEPEVNISFDAAGAREFELLTEKGTGRAWPSCWTTTCSPPRASTSASAVAGRASPWAARVAVRWSSGWRTRRRSRWPSRPARCRRR